MSEFKTVLSRSDGTDVSATVEFDYTPSCRGSRDSFGQQMEPDEPAHCQIIGGKDSNGNDLELTNKEEESLEFEALEQVRENYENAAEAKAEASWEDRRLFGDN